MSAPSTQELLRELVFKLAPSLILTGVHTYTVTKDSGDGRYDLAPGQGVLHPPRLRVAQWSAPGTEATLFVGDKVLLVFVDNDEGKPVMIGHMPLREGKPANVEIDAQGQITIGASSPLVVIGSGPGPLAVGAEIAGRRAICYGDNVQIPVVGASAIGPIIQNPATAPNSISKVRI